MQRGYKSMNSTNKHELKLAIKKNNKNSIPADYQKATLK